MGITSAIVLFAVIWFMTFLVVLPLRLKTQGESGEVVPGTHVSAPSNLDLRGKVRNTTIVAVILWIIIAGVILSGAITVRDMDWFNQLPPAR
jgi:predicted secreted protein